MTLNEAFIGRAGPFDWDRQTAAEYASRLAHLARRRPNPRDITSVQYSATLGRKKRGEISDDRRMPPEDDSRLADRRRRDRGVRPIRDVLAEVLVHYQVRFPGVTVRVVEQPSPVK